MPKSTTNSKSTALVFALSAALVFACATEAQRIDLGQEPELGTGGPFTGVDAAADVDVATVPPRMCPVFGCPPGFTTCGSSSHTCDVELDRDPNNCGECGFVCPRPGSDCVEGRCKLACAAGYADCNAVVEDSCESFLACDENNCGACGNVCPEGTYCVGGKCGCPSGEVVCETWGCECHDLTKDDLHCGACGRPCDPAPLDKPYYMGAYYGCYDNECDRLKCVPSFEDCNDDMDLDGCEAFLLQDPANCGGCGIACKADEFCNSGKCVPHCDETKDDLEGDPVNCGACGHVCPGAGMPPAMHEAPACERGRCSMGCSPPYANCDGDWENGCEIDLAHDVLNCGACGVACAAGQPCVGGRCYEVPCADDASVGVPK